MPRAKGPFEVLERVNDNAYKVDLLGDYQVSATLNVSDLSPQQDDGSLTNLRLNFSKQGEDDGGPSKTCQDKGERGLYSGHPELTVVDSTHAWQGFPWNKSKPDCVFSIC